MPIVIHDFEVVSEPAPRPASSGTAPATEPAVPETKKTAALLQALIRQQERLARLRAH